MLRAKHALADGEHRPMRPLRLGILALGSQRVGQIVSARQGLGILGAEHLLAEGEYGAVGFPGFGIFALIAKLVGLGAPLREIFARFRGMSRGCEAQEERGEQPARGLLVQEQLRRWSEGAWATGRVPFHHSRHAEESAAAGGERF